MEPNVFPVPTSGPNRPRLRPRLALRLSPHEKNRFLGAKVGCRTDKPWIRAKVVHAGNALGCPVPKELTPSEQVG
jgi:hypothetical protein